MTAIRTVRMDGCQPVCMPLRSCGVDEHFAEAGTGVSRRSALLFLATACTGPAQLARAEEAWPVSVTRFVVPFAAGGALDVLARIISERLTRELGATFVIESRPGAGGAIGAQAVVRAPADGSTLLFTSSSVCTLPALNPRLGFDPVRDLLPVSVVCDLPPVLLVRADSRFANLRELIAEARSAPGRLNYGSGGVGSANHLAGALFATMAGIEMVHIPYGGTAQTLNAVYGGQIDFIFAPTLDVLGHVREGRLRALGVGMPERIRALPDVPAITEVVPGYAAPNWFAIFAPARLPESLRTRLVQALASIRDAPELRARFDAGAALPRLDGPEPLAKRMAEEVPRWTQLIAQLGIKPQ
jgi:tripartite-type tricarboxylate transporter receptor subunit TctC